MIIKQISDRLHRSQVLYTSLVETMDEKYLAQKLPKLPSNTVGQQLWCVIGARNSYLKAAQAGKWSGFSCPLSWEDTVSKKQVLAQLESTFDQISDFISSLELSAENEISFLLDLLEHEVQHQGQLIRYMYGLKLQIPEQWKKRYSLGASPHLNL